MTVRLPPPPSATRRALVIVNGGASGIDSARRARDHVVTQMAEADVRADARVTEDEDALRSALEEADGRRIVLVGGDGSINAALNAGVALGEIALVPAGRANNVAGAFGIPTRPGPAARLAAGGVARPVDALRLTTPDGRSRWVIEGVSAGLHAEGRLGYEGENSAATLSALRTAVAAVLRFRPYPVRLRLDGDMAYEGELAQLFLSNLPRFGPGFEVDPVARAADGRFEAVLIRASTRRRALAVMGAARFGRHLERSGVRVLRARTAAIELPIPIVGDGVPIGRTTARVEAVPHHVRLVVPR